ncbi:hypothetical protein HPP92_025385 [Vanilla planifolia]|uniref:Uncharacterized protein n=1 Tax=Vanilla planifolia TaxID=51239 RepID=A0A835PFA4_VANPL|nr:hypothetical protein HPP92_025385 [Vanilla planifolia]
MLPACLPLKRLPWPRPSTASLRLPSPTLPPPQHDAVLSIPSDSQTFTQLLISLSKLPARQPFDRIPHRDQTFNNCKLIHARIHRLGFPLSGKLSTSLVVLYSKSGGGHYAQRAFNLIKEPDKVSWNSVLSAHLWGGNNLSVLSALSSMQSSGMSPDQFSLATALSACARLNLLEEGRMIHGYILKIGLSYVPHCVGSLIDMYAKGGRLFEARQVFDGIPEPDVISWTNMISGYGNFGMAEEALELFLMMRESGVVPDRVTLVAAMTACLNLGRLEAAKSLFREIESPNVVAWNALISGHAQNGHERESLGIFKEMRSLGVRPTRSTMGTILSATANLCFLDEGCRVHSEAIKLGLDSNVFLGTSLISMYAKCDCMEDARRVFASSDERNVVMWNAMFGGLLLHGLEEEVVELFQELKRLDFDPDEVTFLSILGACAGLKNLNLGRQCHSLAIKSNIEAGICFANALVDMYAKCGELSDAKRCFKFVHLRDIVSWNAIMVGHCHNNGEEEALDMFRQMRLECVIPDEVSFSSVISACSNLGELAKGKQIHCLSIKFNLSSNPYVGSSLVDLYTKLAVPEDAVLVFLQLAEKTLPSRNALINCYVQNKQEEQALMLFQQMQLDGICPSQITFGSILPAFGPWGLAIGEQFHCYMLKSSVLHHDDFLKASLMGMYLRSKALADANKLVFEMLDSKNLIIWTIIISGYSQNGYHEEALMSFQKMSRHGLRFDEAIFATTLGACAELAALAYGRKVHGLIISTAFQSYKYTSSTLIEMYSKCGDVESSLQVFEEVQHKDDLIFWNSIIAGLAKNGHAHQALDMFHAMQQLQVNPDGITFLGILTACSHAGLITKGYEFFKSMKNKHEITPQVTHYACMIDLLGRRGYLEEAQDLIAEMPFEAEGLIWATMLAACHRHRDSERAGFAAEKLINLEPNNSTPYVLLSGIHAALGDWAGARRMRHAMRMREVKKVPGCSWIEVGNRTSLFIAGDKFHPYANHIYETVDNLSVLMKDDGYVADLVSIWLDEDEAPMFAH